MGTRSNRLLSPHPTLLFAPLLALALAACGDSGDSSTTPTPSPTPVIFPTSRATPTPINVTPSPTPTPVGGPPTLTMGTIVPNPISLGQRFSLDVSFTDPDGDTRGASLTIAFTDLLRSTIATPIVNTTDGTSGTIGFAQNLPLTLEAGNYPVSITMSDEAGNESAPLVISLMVVDDPCFVEAQAEDNAITLDLDAEFTGCIEDSVDEDNYLARTPEDPAGGGYVVVEVQSSGEFGLSPEVLVIDHLAFPIGDAVTGTPGQKVVAWAAVAAGQFINIRVGALSGPDALNAPYTVKVSYTPVNDTHEPNNEFREASAIDLSRRIDDTYLFHGASQTDFLPDFFKVQATSAGRLRVRVRNVPTNIAVEARVYNTSEVQIAEELRFTEGRELEMEVQVGPGQYFIEIAPFNELLVLGGAGTAVPPNIANPYTLNVDVR